MNDINFENHGRDTPRFTLHGSTLYGRLVEIVDGDTVNIVLHLFNNFYKYNVRLYGIDTCEIHSKNETNRDLGTKARDTVFELVCNTYDINHPSLHSNVQNAKHIINDTLDQHVVVVLVECLDFDKYGRLLANVFLINSNTKLSVSDYLLQHHLAYPYTGSTKLTETEQRHLLQRSNDTN